jgi:hypothetical protein
VCSRLESFELAVWWQRIDIEGSNSTEAESARRDCEVWLINEPSLEVEINIITWYQFLNSVSNCLT